MIRTSLGLDYMKFLVVCQREEREKRERGRPWNIDILRLLTIRGRMPRQSKIDAPGEEWKETGIRKFRPSSPVKERALILPAHNSFLAVRLSQALWEPIQQGSWNPAFTISFPSINGPFPQSLRQSAGLLVRRTKRTTPRNPLISLTLQKIAHFWIGNWR
jgi:hypothetical protein